MEKPTNPERERRILDAAAELFVHYGYDKTTVADIARQAGISKAAIYLHFRGKDDLFEALLLRELQAYAEHWLDRLEADPQGGTLAAMYKNSLYALSHSPFMAAMFRQDGRVLGAYLRKPNNFFAAWRSGQQPSERFVFVDRMQQAGAIRQDIDARVIAYIMDMLAYGLAGVHAIVPPGDRPPVDSVIEGIALIMDRALQPESGGNPEAGKAIVRQIVAAARRQLAERQARRKPE